VETEILKVKHLKKSFGKTEVLHGVDFSVNVGEVYGLVGQNGAGKTTLLRLIAGLMKPTNGVIDCHISKSYIGYMPQSCRFDGMQTVAGTIRFFAALRNANEKDGLHLCRKLELDTAKRVKYLSPGQQKKLQMVIAMTGDPDFYILDEPTAGLDPNASHEMNKLIQELHQRGKSILISSHILQDMDNICTNVAIMESGRLIYDRQIENSYVIETSTVPEDLFTKLAQRFSLSSNQERTLLHIKSDREGVAALIGVLASNSVLVYEAVHSNVKNVVEEQLHMDD
jgi:ABC-type multidrug transport system ATPase subunit